MRARRKMFLKSILLLSVICVATPQSAPVYRYHEDIGIPKAKSVRRSESFGRREGGVQDHDSALVPYQAGIVITLTTNQTSICGGALLSQTRVLTAAHCWFDGSSQAKQFTIVLGSMKLFFGGTRVTTSDVVTHPSWNPIEMTYDIGMVKISSIDYNRNIQAISLASLAEENHLAGMTATLSAYGKTNDALISFPPMTALHYVDLNIVSNAECQKSFDIALLDSHLCTSGQGNIGSNEGDSGGPLTVLRHRSRILIGIVSFALSDGCPSRCPSVYTRVTSHLTWIRSQM